MSEPQYDQGGYIPGSPVPVFIHPDECLLTVDKATKRVTCRRADHPTDTSNCRPAPVRRTPK